MMRAVRFLLHPLLHLMLLLAMAAPARAQQTLEAIVIEPHPLLYKTLNGAIGQLGPEQAVPAGLRGGDLVLLRYGAAGDLDGIERVGGTLIGTLKESADDHSWLIVRSAAPDQPRAAVNVPLQAEAPFRPLVAAMRPGDGVQAVYRSGEGVNRIRTLEWQYRAVPRWQRWLTLAGAAGLLFAVALLLTGFHPGGLILGVDNRYSSSQFQTVLWFWVVLSAYMALVFQRMAAAGWGYVGGVDIPNNLLILSGVSVLSFTGAKLISRSKAGAEGAPLKTMAAAPQPSDLVRDDAQRTDLGDLQMIVITMLAVVIYAISMVEFMDHIEFRRVVTMPDVDATLLAIFTLGQAAYLGKKAAGDGSGSN